VFRELIKKCPPVLLNAPGILKELLVLLSDESAVDTGEEGVEGVGHGRI
jgi:hypothetical protein